MRCTYANFSWYISEVIHNTNQLWINLFPLLAQFLIVLSAFLNCVKMHDHETWTYNNLILNVSKSRPINWYLNPNKYLSIYIGMQQLTICVIFSSQVALYVDWYWNANNSFLLALDTGSDLSWVPCDCIECAPLSLSYYNMLVCISFLHQNLWSIYSPQFVGDISLCDPTSNYYYTQWDLRNIKWQNNLWNYLCLNSHTSQLIRNDELHIGSEPLQFLILNFTWMNVPVASFLSQ